MNALPQVPFEAPTADRLALTLFIAAALHALLILGISFDPLDRPDDQNIPTLDVTVVPHHDTKPPEDADYLAETSQDGAGNTEEKVRPREQSIEQAPPPAPPQESAPAPSQVLTAAAGEEKTPDADKPEQKDKPDTPSASDLINRSLEMLALQRRINETQLVYSKLPRAKSISARTKEYKYASYMRDWVAKIERVGELNYPDAARRQNLSGNLIVQVAVKPDGSVQEITIRKPSGYKILDDAAVRIVRLAAPFAPFPEDIRKETDVLYITRTWLFTSGNRLESR
ncbi:MAG: TonB family protein [Gammaproteobacteria bacterium]|jgi:protein TonB